MLTQNIQLNILIATLTSFFVAGALKILILYFKKEKVRFKEAFSTGGMPSSHTATVIGLTTSIFMHEGFTTVFLVSLFFSIIVMADAIGVRMETGRQAKALNRITKSKLFNELAGHTPKQVLGGVLVGITVAVLLFFASF